MGYRSQVTLALRPEAAALFTTVRARGGELAALIEDADTGISAEVLPRFVSRTMVCDPTGSFNWFDFTLFDSGGEVTASAGPLGSSMGTSAGSPLFFVT